MFQMVILLMSSMFVHHAERHELDDHSLSNLCPVNSKICGADFQYDTSRTKDTVRAYCFKDVTKCGVYLIKRILLLWSFGEICGIKLIIANFWKNVVRCTGKDLNTHQSCLLRSTHALPPILLHYNLTVFRFR